MALLTVAAFATCATASQAGQWNSVAPLSEPLAAGTVTPLTNGEVLAAGGYNGFTEDVGGGTTWQATSELFDPATRSWHRTGSMLAPRRGPHAALLPDGRVLLLGEATTGTGGGEPPVVAEIFDPGSGAWSAAVAPAEMHDVETLTALPDGRVLTVGHFGGTYWGDAKLEAALYDPIGGTWTHTQPPGVKRDYGATATLLGDGDVLLSGGEQIEPAKELPVHDNYTVFSSAETYDPATATWTAVAPMHQPRTHHVASAMRDGSALVAGGEESIILPGLTTLSAVESSAEAFDPASDTWRQLASMTLPRAYDAAATLADGRVIVAGGSECTTLPGVNACYLYGPGAEGACCAASSAEIYEPATDSWAFTGPVVVGDQAGLAAFGNDEALLVGGILPLRGRDLSNVYLYGAPPAAVPSLPAAPAVLAPAVKRPTLGRLAERHRRWRERHRRRRVAHEAPVGTDFEFTLDQPANVQLRFTRLISGHLAGGRCLVHAPRPARRRCTRALAAGSLDKHAIPGRNGVAFTGLLSGKRWLAAGVYRLTVTAVNPGGRSAAEQVTFTIVG